MFQYLVRLIFRKDCVLPYTLGVAAEELLQRTIQSSVLLVTLVATKTILAN
jgi:hypothetical protein